MQKGGDIGEELSGCCDRLQLRFPDRCCVPVRFLRLLSLLPVVDVIPRIAHRLSCHFDPFTHRFDHVEPCWELSHAAILLQIICERPHPL
jgi:hypothetical protein